MSKVLIVDDEEDVLNSFRRQLRKKVELVTASSGLEGLETLKTNGPFSVVVSDHQMPGMDGITFLQKASKIAPDAIPVMLTGNADNTLIIKAINDGHVFRFLEKPCSIENLLSVLAEANERFRSKRMEQDLLERTLAGSVKLLVDLISIQDTTQAPITNKMREWGNKLIIHIDGLSSWELNMGILLHSIGRITLPGEVLVSLAKGTPLNEQEKQLVDQTPEAAHDLILNIPRLKNIAIGIYYQNKEFNGEGFPYDGHKGKEIPLLGRMLKILGDMGHYSSKTDEISLVFVSMEQQSQAYDPELLGITKRILINETQDQEETLKTKNISVSVYLLDEGDRLLSDVKNQKDQLILSKGQVLTQPMIQKLKQIDKIQKFISDIEVQRIFTNKQ
ncbi:HD domain-containing phosphohydrolase [Kiloniella majae]|uniref:HD domain-containing phosphohydrolase n=1 Tax=Kiloniella majae TaxID=1938558 RepID=UPI000A27980D|nr:HD domain-containing phosphohydrolase [Kiloniella majae]